MPPKKHLFEQVADELGSWMATTEEALVAGMHDGDKAPFAAPLTERQKLEVYRAMLENPDGTENAAGAQELIATRGATVYAAAKLALAKDRRRDMDATPPPRTPEPPPTEEGD